MLEKLQLLKIEVEQEIESVKEQLKVSKTDIKKLENEKFSLIIAIADISYLIDSKNPYITLLYLDHLQYQLHY